MSGRGTFSRLHSGMARNVGVVVSIENVDEHGNGDDKMQT